LSASVQRKLTQAQQHLQRGDAAAAAALCEDVLARAPRNPDALWLLGTTRLMTGQPDEAASLLERATAAMPSHGAALEHLGVAHLMRGDYGNAERVLRTAASLRGAPASVPMRLGLALLHQGRADAAAVELDKALKADASLIDARFGLGRAYLTLGRFREAAAALRIVAAAHPDDAPTLGMLAEATFQCGELDEALSAATRARDLDPSQPDGYSLIAKIHHVRGNLRAAVEALETGYARTGADSLLGMLVHLTHRQCDWPNWQRAWDAMASKIDTSAHLGSPFWLLLEDTTAAQQYSYTKRWAALNFPKPAAPPRARGKAVRDRLRIGYYSGDFHQHPVPCLAVEAFELHDRSRFEVFAYSYGPDDKSAMRARLENAFEHFIDVAWDTDDIIEQRIRADDLDILIDLKGYTAGDRLAVMARRPCALQVEWLGYPGTMGAEFFDYVIADSIVIPHGEERHYSERVLRIPYSYQANDRKRAAPEPRSRAEYELPDEAFVFCCFNQSVKITPQIFGRWMSLLRAVPGSVLWLLDDNACASANLKAAAVADGIAAERVVIAPRLAVAEHVARYRAADLALDTFPYTSHTTGSDALWAGCPLVALCGDTFAARVSTSLVTHAGVPELVARSLDEYEKLALRFATDPELMRDTRERLAAARASAPLFDSTGFTRALEALYQQILGAP
jgi:protein O-GlcNAc transferase